MSEGRFLHTMIRVGNLERSDIGLEAGRNLSCILSYDTPTQNCDVSRLNAGHAAQQDPSTFLRSFKKLRAFLDAHSSGNFTHGRQQWQIATSSAKCLIRDCCCS